MSTQYTMQGRPWVCSPYANFLEAITQYSHFSLVCFISIHIQTFSSVRVKLNACCTTASYLQGYTTATYKVTPQLLNYKVTPQLLTRLLSTIKDGDLLHQRYFCVVFARLLCSAGIANENEFHTSSSPSLRTSNDITSGHAHSLCSEICFFSEPTRWRQVAKYGNLKRCDLSFSGDIESLEPSKF